MLQAIRVIKTRCASQSTIAEKLSALRRLCSTAEEEQVASV